MDYASKIGFGYNAVGTLDAATSEDESSTGELGRNEELDYQRVAISEATQFIKSIMPEEEELPPWKRK